MPSLRASRPGPASDGNGTLRRCRLYPPPSTRWALAVQELRVVAPRAHVRVAALVGGPALARAEAQICGPHYPRPSHPLHALEIPLNFRREPFDLAIFFLRGTPRGVRSVRLCDDVIFPVCTPEIAASLRSAKDFAFHPLLWDTSWAGDWGCWLSAAGLT